MPKPAPHEDHLEELSSNYIQIYNSTQKPQTSGPLHTSLPPDATQPPRAALVSASAHVQLRQLSPSWPPPHRNGSGLGASTVSQSPRGVTQVWNGPRGLQSGAGHSPSPGCSRSKRREGWPRHRAVLCKAGRLRGRRYKICCPGKYLGITFWGAFPA